MSVMSLVVSHLEFPFSQQISDVLLVLSEDVGALPAFLRKDPNDATVADLREAGPAALARSGGDLGEVSLVWEVLCACQGFDGVHMRYKGAAVKGLGGFEIAAEAGVPRVQRSLMLKLCELGWLFRWPSIPSEPASEPPVLPCTVHMDECALNCKQQQARAKNIGIKVPAFRTQEDAEPCQAGRKRRERDPPGLPGGPAAGAEQPLSAYGPARCPGWPPLACR